VYHGPVIGAHTHPMLDPESQIVALEVPGWPGAGDLWAADSDGWFLVPNGEILCRES
jgi:hypothetical protein